MFLSRPCLIRVAVPKWKQCTRECNKCIKSNPLNSCTTSLRKLSFGWSHVWVVVDTVCQCIYHLLPAKRKRNKKSFRTRDDTRSLQIASYNVSDEFFFRFQFEPMDMEDMPLNGRLNNIIFNFLFAIKIGIYFFCQCRFARVMLV